MEKRMYKVSEVCELLSVSRSTLYQMIGRRQVPVVHIGRSVRFPGEALDEWIKDKSLEARRFSETVRSGDISSQTRSTIKDN